MLRRTFLNATAMLLGGAGAAAAQQQPAAFQALKPADFPTRPIEFVVTFPPGGGMDIAARILARHVERISGHRVIVTNRTGGSGMVAHAFLARQAAADGYTLGVIANGIFSDSLLRSEGRWSHTDLEPIAFINTDPISWIVGTRGPLAELNLRQILDLARERPGTLRVASRPQGPAEFLIEQVEARTRGRFVRFPVQGNAPGVTALVGGHVEIATAFYSEYRGQLEAGLVRPVAVTGTSRAHNMPDVPTFNETLGVNDILWSAWRFVVVPKATPADRQRYLEALITAALREPAAIEEFARTGAVLDNSLPDAASVRREATQMAEAERAFYRQTGRMP